MLVADTNCVTLSEQDDYVARRRAKDLERYYAKTGRVRVAQTTCESCPAALDSCRADRRFCDGCLRDRLNAYNRMKRGESRRAAGVPPRSGIIVSCQFCASEFARTSHNGKTCKACRAKRKSIIRYTAARRKSDPVFALNHRFSAYIRKSLAGGKDGRHWESIVGYSVAELMQHLERQFAKGMSWDNRGAWHIDHIIPLSSFDYESPDDPDFKAAWALSNLRPLWAKENLSKNAKRTHLL